MELVVARSAGRLSIDQAWPCLSVTSLDFDIDRELNDPGAGRQARRCGGECSGHSQNAALVSGKLGAGGQHLRFNAVLMAKCLSGYVPLCLPPPTQSSSFCPRP